MPPAYEDVWICMLPNGHLQATGIDARKAETIPLPSAVARTPTKRSSAELPAFARALPGIRAAVRRELDRENLTRERVMAGVVALLDITGFRVGGRRYARTNQTFGIVSLLTKHINEAEDHVEVFVPRARRVPNITRRSTAEPDGADYRASGAAGPALFRYRDEEGECHDIGTADVNNGSRRSAGGTTPPNNSAHGRRRCCAPARLRPNAAGAGATRAMKRAFAAAVKATAAELNHTPAVCRKYYVHPALEQAFADGSLDRIMNARAPRLSRRDGTASLHADERRVYRIITRR